jgi:hypothetical protein
MRYLFGDSTPFPLSENFLVSVCAATEACVAILRADEHAADGRRLVREAEQRATHELAKLEALGRRVEEAFAMAPSSSAAMSASEAATTRIHELSLEAIEHARADVMRWRDGEVAAAAKAAPLSHVLPALGAFLSKHQLPDTAWSLRWVACGSVSQAEVYARAAGGLEAVLDVRIPKDHLWSRPVPVSLLEREAVVHVTKKPLIGKARSEPQRLERLFVTAVTHLPDHASMTLGKSSRSASAGLEIVLRGPETPQPTVTRVGPDGKPLAPPEVLSPADAAVAQRLWTRLESTVCDLICHRKQLKVCTLAGVPVQEIVHPEVVAQVILDSMAPLVREVARRTATSGELALKRLVGDGRREELFVPFEMVLAGTGELAERHRALFDVYQLTAPRLPAGAGAVVRRLPPPIVPPVPRPPPQLRVIAGGA